MDDGAFPANSPDRQSSVYQLLEDEQINNIHTVADATFDVLDKNGDGAVSYEELAQHLLLARYTEEAISKIFTLVDVSPKDDTVSREELRMAFIRYPPLRNAPAMGSLSKSQRAAVHDEADETFRAIDADGNGTLSLEELQQHFAELEGPSYSAAAVSRIFDTLDVNSNGEISASEFRGGYVRYRAMRLLLGGRKQGAE